MEHSKINTLAQSPIPPEFDVTKFLEWLVSGAALLGGYLRTVDLYFKHKKTDKEEFITKVVNAAMDSSLKEFKAEFHEHKKEMTAKMDHFNETVLKIYTEVKS